MTIAITTLNGKFKQVDISEVTYYRSSWLTSTSTTQFAHGLSSTPDVVQLWYDDNGTIVSLDDSNLSSVDSTNININFDGLTVDATHKVIIIAYII